MNLTGKLALFVGGTLFGSAGLRLLASEDVCKVYTHAKAAAQRLVGCIDLTGETATVQEAVGEAQSAMEGIPDASALIQGTEALSSAVEELQGILSQMEPYVEALPQLKEWSAAAAAYAEGVKQLSEGAGTMT
jgi:hypothetical protein